MTWVNSLVEIFGITYRCVRIIRSAVGIIFSVLEMPSHIFGFQFNPTNYKQKNVNLKMLLNPNTLAKLIVPLAISLFVAEKAQAQIDTSLTNWIHWEYRGGHSTSIFGSGPNPLGFHTIVVFNAGQQR